MKNMMLITIIVFAGLSAHAKKTCTDQPKDKWMTEEAFKKKAEDLGYKINKFKQPGSCYEIYGLNKDGQDVEVYFNPVDASIIKEKIEKR